VTGQRSMTRTKVAGAVAVIAALLSVGALAGAQADGGATDAAGPTPRAGAASPTQTGFIPITPCRIVNTQNPAGKFAVGEVREYFMYGDTSPQGGSASCGIPFTASALEVAVTAVGAEGEGYLRLYPAGQPEPNATFLNYTDVFNAENAGTIRVTPRTGDNLAVKAFQRRTHVIIDVLGYYVDDLMAVVNSNGLLERGNGVEEVSRLGAGSYLVRFGRVVTGCAYTGELNDTGAATPPVGDIGMASHSHPRTVHVQTRNGTDTLADADFHLVVTC